MMIKLGQTIYDFFGFSHDDVVGFSHDVVMEVSAVCFFWSDEESEDPFLYSIHIIHTCLLMIFDPQ